MSEKRVLFRQFISGNGGISVTKSHLKLVTPTGKNPTVGTPRLGNNAEYRTREHLTEREVERLIEATTSHRDAT